MASLLYVTVLKHQVLQYYIVARNVPYPASYDNIIIIIIIMKLDHVLGSCIVEAVHVVKVVNIMCLTQPLIYDNNNIVAYL